MLSRTADHLFWMARYTERAENTARMLDVHVQTSLLPQSADDAEQGWRAVLGISELLYGYNQKYDKLTPKDVIDFMVRDPNNPSSIASCLRQARENARAVRGTLTTEVWEIQNATWLKMQSACRPMRWSRPQRVLRMGQVPLAPVARRDHGHHAGGRGLPLHPPGHLPGAGRQHGAHHRREVPRRKDQSQKQNGQSQSQSQSQTAR
jgi:hypothetical protein